MQGEMPVPMIETVRWPRCSAKAEMAGLFDLGWWRLVVW